MKNNGLLLAWPADSRAAIGQLSLSKIDLAIPLAENSFTGEDLQQEIESTKLKSVLWLLRVSHFGEVASFGTPLQTCPQSSSLIASFAKTWVFL